MPINKYIPKNLKPGNIIPLKLDNLPLSAEQKQKIAQYQQQLKNKEKLQAQVDLARAKAKQEYEAQLKKNVNPLEHNIQQMKMEHVDPKLIRALAFIDKNCQQFLKEMKKSKKLMFHGFKSDLNPNEIFIGKPRFDREPSDTEKNHQDFLDKALTSNGFKALRSNSIFCSSSVNQTEDYGEVYIIFPLDGFSFTWSTIHSDWVIKEHDLFFGNYRILSGGLNDISVNLESKLKDILKEKNALKKNNKYSILQNNTDFGIIKKFVTQLIDKFDDFEYENEDFTFDELLKFLQKNLPILIGLTKKYPMFPMSKDILKIKTLLTLYNPKQHNIDIIKKNGLTRTHLDVALKTGHEIYLNGIYVAIALYNKGNDDNLKILKKHFGFK
jgi:hypothetical protein